MGDLQRLAKARNADTSDKPTRDRKNAAMKQYTESLLPILIQRMVDGDSANKAKAEAPLTHEVRGAQPASTPAITAMSEAEAEAYAIELSTREAGLEARAATFTGPTPNGDEAIR